MRPFARRLSLNSNEWEIRPIATIIGETKTMHTHPWGQLFCLLFAGVSTLTAAPVAIVNPSFEAPYLGGDLPEQYAGDVPPTAFPSGQAPNGWDAYGAVGNGAFIGVLSPGVAGIDAGATNFPLGAPEGDNVALMYFDGDMTGPEFGLQQTLVETLQPNTIYSLSAAVGNIASGKSSVEPYQSRGPYNLDGFPGYRVELLAGDTVIAVDSDSLQAVLQSPEGEGVFAVTTLGTTIGDTHPLLGQPMRIRLISRNEMDIPGVRGIEVDFDDISLDATPVISGDYNGDTAVDVDNLNLVLFNWNSDVESLPTAWRHFLPSANVGTDQLNGVLFNWAVELIILLVEQDRYG